jgi:hypothetical protein
MRLNCSATIPYHHQTKELCAMADTKLYFIETENKVTENGYLEGPVLNAYSDADIQNHIDETDPDEGERIVVYELVAVAVYETTTGFKKVA